MRFLTPEEKVPQKLQETLDAAFAKAFTLIFQKGSSVIEKTYQKDEFEKNYQIQEYAYQLRKNRKSLKAFSKKAEGTGRKNLLIQGAVTYGEEAERINGEINTLISKEKLPTVHHISDTISKTASLLSGELLYMKFLQGIPIAGAVGGIYDAVYMEHVTEYANLKYKRRFLQGEI